MNKEKEMFLNLSDDMLLTSKEISNEKASDIDSLLEDFLANYKEFIESVKIDNIHIDEIAKDYPARKARYAIALERLKAELSEKKLEQKTLYYELYTRFRKEAIEKGIKITEEYLKALIFTSEEYKQISKEIVDLERKVNILEACKEALEDQGRMLFLMYSNIEKKMF